MHDRGHTNQGLAALRHHKLKRLKYYITLLVIRKKLAKHLQCDIIIKFWVRTAARKARYVFFFVLANVNSMLRLPALRFTIPSALHISLCNLQDECLLFEKFA